MILNDKHLAGGTTTHEPESVLLPAMCTRMRPASEVERHFRAKVSPLHLSGTLLGNVG